jgi:hypothetical protein
MTTFTMIVKGKEGKHNNLQNFLILKIKNWSNNMSVAIDGNVHHTEGFNLTRLEYTVKSLQRYLTTAWLLRQDRQTILA